MCDVHKSGSQQRSYRSGCSSQSDAASCKPSSLLFSYYTSRVYPALRYTPCRRGVRHGAFCIRKGSNFSLNKSQIQRHFSPSMKFPEFSPAQQGFVPNFVEIQKRRRSLHLPTRGSRQPQHDKRKRPTPQYGQQHRSTEIASLPYGPSQ